MYVTYLINCTSYNEQYVASAIDFKKRFRIHKSVFTPKKTDVELLNNSLISLRTHRMVIPS